MFELLLEYSFFSNNFTILKLIFVFQFIVENYE